MYLSLVASTGAQNLFVLSQAVQGEHVRACIAWCVASDVLLVAAGIARGLLGVLGARQQGGLKAVFVLGAPCASLAWVSALVLAGRRLQRLFANARAWRVLDALTGAPMLVLAWWVWQGT